MDAFGIDQLPKALRTRLRRRHLLSGSILFRQGDRAVAVYVVDQGRLAMIRHTPDGHRVTIAFTVNPAACRWRTKPVQHPQFGSLWTVMTCSSAARLRTAGRAAVPAISIRAGVALQGSGSWPCLLVQAIEPQSSLRIKPQDAIYQRKFLAKSSLDDVAVATGYWAGSNGCLADHIRSSHRRVGGNTAGRGRSCVQAAAARGPGNVGVGADARLLSSHRQSMREGRR
jgi:CRP-like cAMP-binding protein